VGRDVIWNVKCRRDLVAEHYINCLDTVLQPVTNMIGVSHGRTKPAIKRIQNILPCDSEQPLYQAVSMFEDGMVVAVWHTVVKQVVIKICYSKLVSAVFCC
jgi:hypothetical protein